MIRAFRSRWLGLSLLLAIVGCRGASDVDLSPARWPQGELARFAEREATRGEPNPLATGEHGMVSGVSAALAVRAGLEALQQGGSALDAALTHAFANIVLLTGCCVSHAGFMTMVYYEAATGEVHSLNAAWNTVKAETDPMSIPSGEALADPDTPLGRTVLVPGFMAGAEAAHQRFGRLPWAALFSPAIYFAEEGFVLTAGMATQIDRTAEWLSKREETKRVFTDTAGEWYQAGDVMRQPELAATLRGVAAEGASYMYRGAWGRHFVDAVRELGGKMTMDDLAAYQAIWSDPIYTRFRDYDVYAIGRPNTGGVNMIEALNLVELADLPSTGHFTESPQSLYRLIRIARVPEVMGTSLTSAGVPQDLIRQHLPELDVSLDARVTKAAAQRLWSMMESEAWTRLDREVVARGREAHGHSDAVVATDRWGNAAAVLHTLNSAGWGGIGLMVDGVSVAGAASFQQPGILEAGPGQRLPEETNPLIVLRDGKPVLVSSSIGMGVHEQTLQSLVSVLEFGLDPLAAVDGPQFFRPASGGAVMGERLGPPADQTVGSGELAPELLRAVEALGLSITELPPERGGWYRGYWVGIYIDPMTGRLSGASPRHLTGWALGY